MFGLAFISLVYGGYILITKHIAYSKKLILSQEQIAKYTHTEGLIFIFWGISLFIIGLVFDYLPQMISIIMLAGSALVGLYIRYRNNLKYFK